MKPKRSGTTNSTWIVRFLQTNLPQSHHQYNATNREHKNAKPAQEQHAFRHATITASQRHGITVLQCHVPLETKHRENAAHRPQDEVPSPARAHSSPEYKNPRPPLLFCKQHQTATVP